MEELLDMDGVAQAQCVRRGETTARELARAAFTRLDRVNPTINAIVVEMREQALMSAELVDNSQVDSPFRGVPFLLKDLGPTCAGAAVTLGSAFVSNYRPKRDAELVQRFRRAGLVLLGKTNSAEFGALPTTEPAFTGATRNPWALERSTGGSSGGATAAVAAGIVAVAHANDAGGSIRIPASCCGVFGLKPTRARVPLGPDVGDLMNGLVTEFVVSRSVRDSAHMLDAVAGPAIGDPYFAPAQTRSYRDAAAQGTTHKLRIGIDSNLDGLHPECARAVAEAGQLCAALGHRLEPCVPPLRFSEHRHLFLDVWAAGVSSAIMSVAGLTGRVPQPDLLEPVTYHLYEQGRKLSAAEYLVTVTRLQQLARRLATFYADYDVVLSAVTREPAPLLGELVSGSPEQQLERALDFVFDAPLANLVGNPAMSVPLHLCADGSPVGVQFTARVGHEDVLLGLAMELEQAKPWAGKFPTIPGGAPVTAADLKEKSNVSYH